MISVRLVSRVTSRPFGLAALLCLAGMGALACGSADDDKNAGKTGSGGFFPTGGLAGGSGGSGGSSTGSGGSGVIVTDSGPGNPPRDGGSVVGPVPADFVKTEAGGYKLGPPVTGQGTTDTGINNQGGCGVIVGVVRDFKGNNESGGHPDFERFSGASATKNMVLSDLGADLKPVYTPLCEMNAPGASCPNGQQTTAKTNFDQWYRFTDGVNRPYLVYFMFQSQAGSNVITFNSQFFFPLDGAGWNSAARGNDNKMHNFGFTTSPPKARADNAPTTAIILVFSRDSQEVAASGSALKRVSLALHDESMTQSDELTPAKWIARKPRRDSRSRLLSR